MRGVLGFSGAARRLAQGGEGLPTRRQRRVAVHCPLVGGDRCRHVAEGPVAMAALLKKTAIVRVQILESLERRQRVGNSSEVALTDGDQVKDVAVLGEFGKER